MEFREFTLDSLKMLIIVGAITLVGNTLGYGIGIAEAAPGMALIVVIGLVSLVLGRTLPVELPSFAYAMIIAFALALPFSPVQATVLSLTEKVNFLATTTPILAYAGLSIGLQTTRMKGSAGSSCWSLCSSSSERSSAPPSSPRSCSRSKASSEHPTINHND